MKSWDWTLSKAERQALETQWAQTHDAATYRRLWALLELDQGHSVAEVARQLRVGRCSVYRWIERFAAQGEPAALEQQPGQRRPPLWNEQLARLVEVALEQPPFRLGYPANTWTAPLLHAFLSDCLPEQPVSVATVRGRLKAMGHVWKRFRHGLPPDPQAEKKNAGSCAKSGICPWAPPCWRRMKRTCWSFHPCARAGPPGRTRPRAYQRL